MPFNLSDLSDDELMNLFSKLVRWTNHIGAQLGLQEISERYSKSAYELAYAQCFEAIMATKRKVEGNITVVRNQTLQTPAVRALQEESDQIYARRKILGLMYENLERDGNLVSRELTRRTSREPKERRSDSYRP